MRLFPAQDNKIRTRLEITSRFSWSDGVVPAGASCVLLDHQSGHLSVADFDSLLIVFLHHGCPHTQTRRRLCLIYKIFHRFRPVNYPLPFFQ